MQEIILMDGLHLCWLAVLDKNEVVKLLLDHSDRIDFNAKNDNGETAMMIACRNGQEDIVQLIVNHRRRKF